MSNNHEGKDHRLASIHLFYLGGLLVEGMKSFHQDILMNYRSAGDVIGRATYQRMVDLRDKFEQAALLEG